MPIQDRILTFSRVGAGASNNLSAFNLNLANFEFIGDILDTQVVNPTQAAYGVTGPSPWNTLFSGRPLYWNFEVTQGVSLPGSDYFVGVLTSDGTAGGGNSIVDKNKIMAMGRISGSLLKTGASFSLGYTFGISMDRYLQLGLGCSTDSAGESLRLAAWLGSESNAWKTYPENRN